MFITQQSAQNIANEMKRAIHHDINIMDANGIILASTNLSRIGQHHSGAAQIIRQSLPSQFIWADDPEQGVQRGINLPIKLDGDVVGVIGVTGDPKKVSVFGEIIQRMTEIMVQNAHRQEQSDLIYQAKSIFVENWLFTPSITWEELETRSRLLGMDIYKPYTVAMLDIRSSTSNDVTRNYSQAEDLHEMRNGLILRTLQSHLRDNRHHFCALIRNKFIVLLNGVDQQDAYFKIKAMCQEISNYHNIVVSGGISNPTRDPLDLYRCYIEAQTACRAAAQSQSGQVFLYNQVSLDLIVQSIPSSIRSDMQKMLFSSCSPQEREEFTSTIALYFEEDGDIKRCAERLFVHRNTFQYRMDQLKKKTGYSLKVPKDAMLLYLAISTAKETNEGKS